MNMDKLAGWCGCAIFIGCLLHFLGGYGARWQIGRYGLPAPLVAPDGQHYQDGSEIDPVNLWLVRNDAVEACELALVGLIVGLVVFVFAKEYWRDVQRERALRRTLAASEAMTVTGVERSIRRVVLDAQRIARRVAGLGKRGM